MSTALSSVGAIFILLSVLFHAYVFTLESLTWSNPKTWKMFGLPNQEHAEIIKTMAFNQGFYNLFLAIGAGVGLVLLGINSTVALSLLSFSSVCMVGAGVVLFFSVKTSRRSAFIQAGPPLMGLVLLLIGKSF